MNKKSAIVVFIGCLLILTNFSVVASAVTVSTSINKNPQNPVEKIDPKSIKNENVISPETYKVVPTIEEKSTPTLEENKVTTTQQNEKEILTNAVPVSVGYTVQPGEQATPGSQYIGIANAGGPYQGQPGTAITFHSKGFIQIGAIYEWDFGDNFDSTPGFGTHPTHTYTEAKNYTVTLTVTKTNGDIYMDIAQVCVGTVNNELIPYGGVSYEAEINEPITFDASQSKIDSTVKPVKYRWDFGDGEVSQWSFNPQISHTYEKERVYQVKLEIKDKFGNIRYDILHADIGCSFSSYKKFFINTDGVLDDLIDVLFDDQGSGWIICEWLKVYLYYRYDNGYNTVENTIKIDSFNDFPMDIDFNNDGTSDLQIGAVNLLKLHGQRNSPFHETQSIQFNTDLADIMLQGCVTDSDDITVCLQFTIPPIFADLIDLEEPVVRVGFHSEAGQEKPTNFKITHMFRPYLLYYLLGGNNQNNNQNTPNQGTYYSTQEVTTYPYVNPPQPMPANYGDSTGSTAMGSTPISGENVQVSAQQTTQPMVPQGTSGIYPEQDITITAMDSNGAIGKSFSLIAIIAEDYSFVPSTTLAISFESMFDTPFVFTHRKAEADTDVKIEGNDSSSITFSITRKNSEGNSATLGILISPVQNLGLHFEINRVDQERQVELNIDNPPEAIVVFFETENSENEQNGRYFYMKNIPESIGLRWVPSLANGYIDISRDEASEDFEIGLWDDLENPETRLYVSDLPENINLTWQIFLGQSNTVTLFSSIAGLTINAELNDSEEPNRHIEAHATFMDDLNLTFEWSLQDSYFSLKRSPSTIAFDISLQKNNQVLDVLGNYTTGDGEGLNVTFAGIEQGIILRSGKKLDMHITAKDLDSTAYLETDIAISKEGSMVLEWDQSKAIHLESTLPLTFSDLLIDVPAFYLSAKEINFTATATFDIDKEDEKLEFSGYGGITLKNIETTIDRWSGSLEYAKPEGFFKITLKPQTKYYKIESYAKIEVHNIAISYDDPANQYDMIFGLESFELGFYGYIWNDYNLTAPQLQMQTYENPGSSNCIDIENLYFTIGTTINFTLSSFHMAKPGLIYTILNSNQYFISTSNIAFNWSLDLQTAQYGHWQFNGIYNGSGTINVEEWNPGASGQIYFVLTGPLSHSLEIIHNNIKIELGEMNLYTGSTYPRWINLEWNRQQLLKGWFNVTNTGVYGSISLGKITILNSQNPIIIELGNCTIQQTTVTNPKTSVGWDRTTDQKKLEISNNRLIDLALIKVTWDNNKILNLGNLALHPGDFKFTWDTLNKIITVNNGVSDFSPIFTYEDSDRKLSVDLLNLVNDYSKTMTLKWYQDNSNKIIGVYLDTDNANLVDWIVFESIKYASNPNDVTGRRIALGGFQADDFKIMKNTNNQLEVSGKLYLANHLTYSKLSNYSTNQWKDLDLQWDLNLDGVGNIELNTDLGFDEDMKLSTTLAGVNITSTFELPQHLKFGWDVDFDGQGNVTIDTNYEEIYEITFEMEKDTTQYHPKWGFYIGAIGLKADDYKLYWDFSQSPGNWVIGSTGEIEPGCLNDLYIAWNGQWYNLLLNGQPSQR